MVLQEKKKNENSLRYSYTIKPTVSINVCLNDLTNVFERNYIGY